MVYTYLQIAATIYRFCHSYLIQPYLQISMFKADPYLHPLVTQSWLVIKNDFFSRAPTDFGMYGDSVNVDAADTSKDWNYLYVLMMSIYFPDVITQACYTTFHSCCVFTRYVWQHNGREYCCCFLSSPYRVFEWTYYLRMFSKKI